MDSGSYVDVVKGSTSAWLPTNYETLSITYNHRFMISNLDRETPLVWAVTKISDTQPMGLIKLGFTQETYSPTLDNKELMLCNFYDSVIEPTEPDVKEEILGTAEITYSGTKPTIKVGGSWKIFTPVFSTEGTTADKWFISNENGDVSGDTDNYTIEYADQLLKIKVAQNYYLIGTVLIIQVVGSDGSTAQVEIEIMG